VMERLQEEQKELEEKYGSIITPGILEGTYTEATAVEVLPPFPPPSSPFPACRGHSMQDSLCWGCFSSLRGWLLTRTSVLVDAGDEVSKC